MEYTEPLEVSCPNSCSELHREIRFFRALLRHILHVSKDGDFTTSLGCRPASSSRMILLYGFKWLVLIQVLGLYSRGCCYSLPLGRAWAAWVEADEGRFSWLDSKPQYQPQETGSKEVSTKASLRLPGRKRILQGIVQSTCVKLLFWNALKKCWPIFADDGRHVGRLVSPLLPMCICCAQSFLQSSLEFAPFFLHLDRKLRRSEKPEGRKVLLKGIDSTAWFCIQLMLMIHQPFSSLSCA